MKGEIVLIDDPMTGVRATSAARSEGDRGRLSFALLLKAKRQVPRDDMIDGLRVDRIDIEKIGIVRR